MHGTEATVELDRDGRIETYTVRKNGVSVTLPELGDPHFLLAGILSNDSRILRQLHGLDEREADDFKWAVQELSSAERYERISEILKNTKEELRGTLFHAQKVLRSTKELTKQKEELEKKLQRLDAQLTSLRPKFGDIGPIIERREKVGRQINELVLKIATKNSEIEKITREQLDPPKKELKEAQDKKKRIEREFSVLGDVEKLERENKVKEKEASAKLEQLTNQRSEIDVLLSLFVTAEASLRSHKDAKHVTCPLCEEGKLSYDRINQKLSELRHQKEKINGEISE